MNANEMEYKINEIDHKRITRENRNKIYRTWSAFSQKPRKKSTQISVLSLTFLCRYGQSVLKHIPRK